MWLERGKSFLPLSSVPSSDNSDQSTTLAASSLRRAPRMETCQEPLFPPPASVLSAPNNPFDLNPGVTLCRSTWPLLQARCRSVTFQRQKSKLCRTFVSHVAISLRGPCVSTRIHIHHAIPYHTMPCHTFVSHVAISLRVLCVSIYPYSHPPDPVSRPVPLLLVSSIDSKLLTLCFLPRA